MKLPRLPAEEHSNVGILLRSFTLKFDDIPDILKLSLSETITFATESTENESAFLLAADFDQPTGRLGHCPDNDGKNDEREDLESDGETPDER